MDEPMDRSHRIVGNSAKFEEVYPHLEDAIFEWTEQGTGFRDLGEKTKEGSYACKISAKVQGEKVSCSNRECKQGGYELGFELRDMVRNKETVKEGTMLCEGSEGSPKLRRRYRSCVNGIKYRITVIYKKPEAEKAV